MKSVARKTLIELAIREYGSKSVGEVTLDQVYGGARGIKSLVWEVSITRNKGLDYVGGN